MSCAIWLLGNQAVLAEVPTPPWLSSELPKAESKEWSTIPKTAVNLAHADKILRSLDALESAEGGDWKGLSSQFAAFKEAVGNSPFNGLSAVTDVVNMWSLSIAARGGNVVEAYSVSKVQASSIRALLQASAKASSFPISSKSGSVNTELEYNQKTNSDNLIHITITGKSLGKSLLEAREHARSRMEKEFSAKGFPKQVAFSDIIGQWRWPWVQEGGVIGYIIFDLKKNGVMYADLQATTPSDLPGGGVINKGKGTWALNNNMLTITMTHVGKFGLYPKENMVRWINDCEITYFDKTKILLYGSGENHLDKIYSP